MDFGAVGLDNFLSSNSNNGSAFASESDADVIKHRLYGSGFLKQESPVDEDDLRAFKLPKTPPCPKLPCNNNTPSLSEHQQQMLSFSSPNSQMLSFSSHSSQSMAFPFYPHASTAISRSSGYGSVNTASMNAMLSGVRGPFTPSQWMELEHQALIYKYITANVPIPSYLLNPIRKALESSGFSCFIKPNALGWGAFHLGFSNTDPEPGRCRRTDGKKWRCSRDAVPDQKYCERHINRGRHRSRKPVEPQPGHSDKLNNVQPRTNDHLSGKASIDRSVVEKENAKGAYQHTKMCIKDNQQSGYTESSRPEFGSVCSDSLLNPLNRSSSLVNTRNYTECDSKSEHVLRQFIDDHYPKSQSARLPVSWPDVDRTQLSISIPTVTSEFMSSSSSPAHEKLKASPTRLSREVEATQMGLGIGAITNEQSQRQNGWVPISWEPSIGGPLGEALHTTSECKNSKALNLIENWDHSPRLGPSSFGVIPTVESTKTTLDGASLYNGLVGPGLMLPSLPAL